MIPVRFKYHGKNRTFYVAECYPVLYTDGSRGITVKGHFAVYGGTYGTSDIYHLSNVTRGIKYNGRMYDFRKPKDIELFGKLLETDLAFDNLE